MGIKKAGNRLFFSLQESITFCDIRNPQLPLSPEVRRKPGLSYILFLNVRMTEELLKDDFVPPLELGLIESFIRRLKGQFGSGA